VWSLSLFAIDWFLRVGFLQLAGVIVVSSFFTSKEKQVELFSRQQGFVPVRSVSQVNDLDKDTRTDIWNYLSPIINRKIRAGDKSIEYVLKDIWTGYLRQDVDSFTWSHAMNQLKLIVQSGEWFYVMDILQLFWKSFSSYSAEETRTKAINDIFERNLVGFRIVKGSIIPVADQAELTEINEAIDSSPVSASREHLNNAVNELSKRPSANYKSVLLESIQAVEAAVKDFTEKKDPSQAFKDLKTMVVDNHPALFEGWNNLYGFTSDDKGIRHALKDDSIPADEPLAIYFLVICSGFINYLAKLKAKSNTP